MIGKIQSLLLNKWEEYGISGGRPDKLYLSVFAKDQVDGKIFIYVFKNKDSSPSLIIKVRKDKNGINCFRKQYDNLCYMHSDRSLDSFARYAPRPVICEELAGESVYSETFVEGSQLKNTMSSRLQVQYLLKAVEWLKGFHQATCRYEECGVEQLRMEIFLPQSYLGKIKECGLNISQIEEYIYSALKNRSSNLFPFVFYHGDFTSYNILTKREDIGIVDWEYSSLKGAPVLDLLTLFSYFGYKKFKGSFYKSFLWAFSEKGGFSKLCKESIAQYNNMLKIENSLMQLFILRFLLELIFLKDKERGDIIILVSQLLKRTIKLNIEL